jgi:hypothetical protein
LLKLGYSYKELLSKLLNQTTLLPSFILKEIILLINPAFTKRVPLIVGETDKRMQEIEIIKCEIGRGELINLENLLLRTKNLWIINVNILVIKNFSSYLDYYLPMPKVIITLVGRGKLTNIRVILNIRAKVSIISLNAALRFKILITYSIKMAL